MEARGGRNLESKSTTNEPTASSEEDGGHDEDLMKRDDEKHQTLATKPTAEDGAVQPAGAGEKKEKRKRVVIDRKHQGLIDSMIVHSTWVYEIPDEQLARYSEENHARYAERKARYEKWMADEQALIDQYLINGYAESVWEVTDDEDDGEETVEKKDNIN